MRLRLRSSSLKSIRIISPTSNARAVRRGASLCPIAGHAVLRGRSGGLQFQGQMHAFMAAVLPRMAGLDAHDLMPSPSHQPDSRDSPNRALGLAKGTPFERARDVTLGIFENFIAQCRAPH